MSLLSLKLFNKKLKLINTFVNRYYLVKKLLLTFPYCRPLWFFSSFMVICIDTFVIHIHEGGGGIYLLPLFETHVRYTNGAPLICKLPRNIYLFQHQGQVYRLWSTNWTPCYSVEDKYEPLVVLWKIRINPYHRYSLLEPKPTYSPMYSSWSISALWRSQSR